MRIWSFLRTQISDATGSVGGKKHLEDGEVSLQELMNLAAWLKFSWPLVSLGEKRC